MLLSLIGGTLLAVGSVFLLEMVDERLKAPPDVVRELGHAVLGLVPEVKLAGAARVSLARRDAPRELMETFRVLRTSVISAMQGERRRSILIASAAQREGKTHVAANLAIALAQAQQRVLLIDADLRRPSVHDQMSGHRLEPGLSNVLTGSAALNDALQPASVPGLTVLAAGTPSSEAPELLGSTVFQKLLDVLHDDFDWVVIDSPPVLTVTDASVIAPHATGVVFVVASALTRGRRARLAIDQLQRVGGRLVGVVMNRADLAHHPFYFEPYSATDYYDSLEGTSRRSSAVPSTESTR
jgi:capsular exopolysaccharide synthesis family protein